MRFAGSAQVQGKSIVEVSDEVRQMFLNLPSEKYPTVVRLAEYAASPDMDRQYQFGLEVLLKGWREQSKKE